MTAIIIPYRPIGKPLQELIDEHNAVVSAIWRDRGSACKPYQSPSTVPADVPVSRVVVSAEHGGSPSIEVTQ